MNIRTVSIAALMIFSAVFLSLFIFVTKVNQTESGPTPPASGPSSGPSSGPTSGTPPSQHGVANYTVRGRLISLPSADGKQPMQIHHEAIPDFKGKSGTVTGMKEMIMPFPDIAPQVRLAGLTPGQAIEFTFEVRWDAPPRTLVVNLVSLPSETPLNLSEVVEQGR